MNRLDLYLDEVKRGELEITFDVAGYSVPQIDCLKLAAQARGLHVSGSARWILVRDLREVRKFPE
jgi:hypothetical protein